MAGPPGVAYRARKFVQRHRAALAVSAVIALMLAGATAGVAWQAAEARAERDKARIVADFMADTLGGVASSVARGRDTTMLREMMEKAAGRSRRANCATRRRPNWRCEAPSARLSATLPATTTP